MDVRERLSRQEPQSKSRGKLATKAGQVRSGNVHSSLGFHSILSNGKFAEIDCVHHL